MKNSLKVIHTQKSSFDNAFYKLLQSHEDKIWDIYKSVFYNTVGETQSNNGYVTERTLQKAFTDLEIEISDFIVKYESFNKKYKRLVENSKLRVEDVKNPDL